jgi:hypothetical protein
MRCLKQESKVDDEHSINGLLVSIIFERQQRESNVNNASDLESSKFRVD